MGKEERDQEVQRKEASLSQLSGACNIIMLRTWPWLQGKVGATVGLWAEAWPDLRSDVAFLASLLRMDGKKLAGQGRSWR